uniref:MATH domain-containing protein n=1 Tax=Amphimedon queenslandica TaxID=400682 RepID=A0A1X7T0P9_AMPQE
HPACKILARYASNQSLVSALPQFAALLCIEKIIKELATNVPGETLLIQTKKAVCDDYQKLRAFAETLLKFKMTAVIGKAIMTEYGEIFCKNALNLNDCELMSDNSSLDDISMLEFLVNKLNIEEAKLVVQKYKEVIEKFSKIELSKCLHERFSHASLLQCESVTIVVDRKTDDLTLDDVRRLSANLFDELSPNVRLNVIRDGNSFTITCSFPLVLSEQLITAALHNIDVLKENKVKRLTIGHCTVYEVNDTSTSTELNEHQHTSSLPTSSGLSKQLMLSLSVQLINSKEEVTTLNEKSMTMKEEAESLKETLDTKNKMLRVSRGESDRFKRIAEEIEKQSKAKEVESKQEIELLQEKISRMSVQQIEDSKEMVAMKKEAQLLKEALDAKNKMLSVSVAESERLKRIAAETKLLLQEKELLLSEHEQENEKLKEKNKLLEEQLDLFQSEKERIEVEKTGADKEEQQKEIDTIMAENEKLQTDLAIEREQLEKIAAEKEELQKYFDAYEKKMMEKFEKLQADLVNKKLETDENEQAVQIKKLKLTRVPTLHDDWRESHTLPVEVLMTSFASHHKSNDHWYSPSFYSHQEGYKLCLRVRANGESEGSGTHLSIHVHLMRGDHDETLKWPVRGKVKLELLNRKCDEDHFAGEIEFNDDSNSEATGRVVNGIQISSGTAAFVGQGGAAFIPQDLIFKDYMKDDSIRIRITSVDLSGQGNSIPISVATSGPFFEFRVNKFSTLQKSNGSYVCDPFYTHKEEQGYKFVFMVYPNGVGANKGKNVSIFAHLTKGENDDRLKFPFRGEITLQAVNCRADQDHAEKVIRINDFTDPKEMYGGRVPWYNVTGRALNGYGFPEFLRHEQLKYNEKNNTQYLDDNDSMLFRVTNVRVMSV